MGLDLMALLAPGEKRRREEEDRRKGLIKVREYFAQPDRFEGLERGNAPPPADVMAAYETATGMAWPSRPVTPGQAPTVGDVYGSNVALNLPTEVPMAASSVRSPLEEQTYGIEERGKALTEAELAKKIRVRDWLKKEHPLLSEEDLMENLGIKLPYDTRRGRAVAEAEQDYTFGLEHPTTTLGFAMQEEGYPGTGSIGEITGWLAKAKKGEGDLEGTAKALKFWRTVQKAFTMSDMEALASAIGGLSGTEYEDLKDKPPEEIAQIANQMIRQLTQKLIQETGYVPTPRELETRQGGRTTPNDPKGIFH